MQPHSDAFVAVDRAVQAFTAGTPAAQLTTTGWTTHHWLHFLRNLPEAVDAQKMADLDATFHLSQSGNSEILDVWLLKVVESKYEPAYPALEQFLIDSRPAQVRPAALHRDGEEPRRGRDGAADLREGAARIPLGVAGTVDEVLGWRG